MFEFLNVLSSNNNATPLHFAALNYGAALALGLRDTMFVAFNALATRCKCEYGFFLLYYFREGNPLGLIYWVVRL